MLKILFVCLLTLVATVSYKLSPDLIIELSIHFSEPRLD